MNESLPKHVRNHIILTFVTRDATVTKHEVYSSKYYNKGLEVYLATDKSCTQ